MPVPPEQKPPTPQSAVKLNLWQRIVQRYYWMSFWNRMALWAFLALIIFTVGSFQFVVPAYRHFKSQMYLRMADEFFEKGDFNAASLSFRKAILSGNRNPEVWKRVGAFLEKMNSPEVAKIWETLSELEPDVPSHKIKQAESMLQFGRTQEAADLLNRLPDSDRKNADFYRVAAQFALTKRDYLAARDYFSAWLALEPDNPAVAFRKKVAEMYFSDPLVAYPAKDAIEAIAKAGGPDAPQAWRELIARSIQEGDTYDAARLATRLVEDPNATFDDMATYLNLEIATKSFSLPLALNRFLEFAKNDPAQLPKVANFLLERGQLESLRSWMSGLPKEVILHPDVQTTRFQIALATQDWPEAFAMLRENRLPLTVPPDLLGVVEKAFAERAERSKEADQTWQRAIYMAQGNAGALQIMSLMAEANGWTFAVGRALTAITDLASGSVESWRRLARHEALTGNLAGYHHALTGMMRINPFDLSVSTDWVLSSVLLRKEDPAGVLAVAERAYGSTYPANPSAATAYAVALLGANRASDALTVIANMTTADQQRPERAIYVGAVLAANGKNEEAMEFLQRSGDISNFRFSEEMGFRRVWEGVVRGEESAQAQLERILNQRDTWRQESERIAQDVRREIEVSYDPAQSRKILEELKTQNEQRRQTPAELQRLLMDLQASPAPVNANP